MIESNSQIPGDKKKKLILIDCYGFVFRAYHSMPGMYRRDGTPVGAVRGFSSMLLKLLDSYKDSYILPILDAGSKTFRHEIYKEYKANRPPVPEDLLPQFSIIREALEAFNLPIIEKIGYEADDLIATYSELGRDNYDVIIVSSDKDLMQLIKEGVFMYDPMKQKYITPEDVKKKFGVGPEKILDMLSLMGDSSDNIPGAAGIGPKTASLLLNEYNDLEGIFKNIDNIKQSSRKKSVVENIDNIYLSKKLVSLCYDVPLEITLDKVNSYKVDFSKLLLFFNKQNFKALIRRIERQYSINISNFIESFDSKVNKEKDLQKDYTYLHDLESLNKWISNTQETYFISIFPVIEKNELVSVSISTGHGRAACIEFCSGNKLTQVDLLPFSDSDSNNKSNISVADFCNSISSWLEDDSILKIFYDTKVFLSAIYNLPVKVSSFDDISIISFLLSSISNQSIQDLFFNYLDVEQENLNFKKFKEFSIEDKKLFLCKISDNMILLAKRLKNCLCEEKLMTFYERIDKKLIPVILDMEKKGIKIDVSVLKSLSKEFSLKIQELESKIFQISGCEFNIASPKQLGEVLFEKIGIEVVKVSKKGFKSTGAEILEKLSAEGIEIADYILSWRHLSKLKTTYTEALQKQIGDRSRVYTNFSMTSTSTGRLSSFDPNLQNIPIRTEEGNSIREAFISEKGTYLLSADYSQIELRLLAEIADIEILKKAFKENIDIHDATAKQIFGSLFLSGDSDTKKDLRRKAKTINFGIIYGISAFGLGSRLGITTREASQYIKEYFKQYPGIKKYMDDIVEFAKTNGFVETIWGRKCYIRDIESKNVQIRKFSERVAINAPLQGSSADIIKKAMIDLTLIIKKNNYKTNLLLQIHDELVLEVPKEELEEISKILKETMEKAVSDLSVPLVSNVKIGKNWLNMH